MIGIDTNVIVRILVADDPDQTARAVACIESRCPPDDPGLVNAVVLSEIVWVLERAYGYRRPQIADAVGRVLASRHFHVEHDAEARSALVAYRTRKCDFADALIGEINVAKGCETTVTFDVGARRLKTFSSVAAASRV